MKYYAEEQPACDGVSEEMRSQRDSRRIGVRLKVGRLGGRRPVRHRWVVVSSVWISWQQRPSVFVIRFIARLWLRLHHHHHHGVAGRRQTRERVEPRCHYVAQLGIWHVDATSRRRRRRRLVCSRHAATASPVFEVLGVVFEVVIEVGASAGV